MGLFFIEEIRFIPCLGIYLCAVIEVVTFYIANYLLNMANQRVYFYFAKFWFFFKSVLFYISANVSLVTELTEVLSRHAREVCELDSKYQKDKDDLELSGSLEEQALTEKSDQVCVKAKYKKLQELLEQFSKDQELLIKKHTEERQSILSKVLEGVVPSHCQNPGKIKKRGSYFYFFVLS